MLRVSSAFWLVYQARSIRGFLLYANYRRVNQRARLLARDHYLPPLPRISGRGVT